MASQEQVREYLAHWFQLGKPIVLENGKAECLPYPIFFGNRYSQAFEECWQQVLHVGGEGCYLKGTGQTIAMLLSPAWALVGCARCSMPIPLPDLGSSDYPCPCHDLTIWPNYDVPLPRMAADTHQFLTVLQKRLDQMQGATAEVSAKRTALDGDSAAQRTAYEDDLADVASIVASWRGTS